ncbi:MAG: hypothetical protein QME76_12890 [Bacillota bacterium]|nr:hypothetical protein [Bacillota bacterium]
MDKEFGCSKPIYYFSAQGKVNLEKTVELVARRALNLHLNHIVVFAGDGRGVFLLHEVLQRKRRRLRPQIVAVTFPYKTTFVTRSQDGTTIEFTPPTSDQAVKTQLDKRGIKLVMGALPLWEIVLPGTADDKVRVIEASLSLFSGGMSLCVQAILMACDAGCVEPGEEVIGMSADTAIVATAAQTRWLFHPTKGLQVKEIICMPRQRSFVRDLGQEVKLVSAKNKKEG